MCMCEWAKEEFEKLYDSKLSIIEKVEKKVNGITKFVDSVVASDVPCRISTKSAINPVNQTENAKQTFVLALYVAPDVVIKAGSKLEVTNIHGETVEYRRTGEGIGSYNTHKAYPIERAVTA